MQICIKTRTCLLIYDFYTHVPCNVTLTGRRMQVGVHPRSSSGPYSLLHFSQPTARIRALNRSLMMAHLSQLPIELQHSIVRYLTHMSDRDTMAETLRRLAYVSQHWHNIVLDTIHIRLRQLDRLKKSVDRKNRSKREKRWLRRQIRRLEMTTVSLIKRRQNFS